MDTKEKEKIRVHMLWRWRRWSALRRTEHAAWLLVKLLLLPASGCETVLIHEKHQLTRNIAN